MSVMSSGGSPNSINMRVCLVCVIYGQSDEILIRWIIFFLFWHSNSWREIQTIILQLAKYQAVLKSDETFKNASKFPSFTERNSKVDVQILFAVSFTTHCIYWISVYNKKFKKDGTSRSVDGSRGFKLWDGFFLSAGLGCYSAVLFVEKIKVCLWSVFEK